VAEEYPYDAKNDIVALVETLEIPTKRDPEQEVQGIALPVLDAVIEPVRAARPDDPVVEAVRCISRPTTSPRANRSGRRMRCWSPSSSTPLSASTRWGSPSTEAPVRPARRSAPGSGRTAVPSSIRAWTAAR
jgi:hypothetical protein